MKKLPTFLSSNLGLFALAALVAVLCGQVAYSLVGSPQFGIDDADITMVYARNLARGFGYVYQVGGERVEGSTSLLWTLLSAAWFSFEPSSFASLFWVACALTTLNLFACLCLARSAVANGSAILVATLLLASAATFHAWAGATLMDTALWSALCAFAVLAVSLPPTRSSLLFGCVALVALVLGRPEGMALGPLWGFFHGFSLYLRGRPNQEIIRRTGWLLGAVVATIIVSTAFRWLYFGYPLPNTYYAKVGGNPVYTAVKGIKYILWFLRTSPLSVLIPVALGLGLFVDGRAVLERWKGSRTSLDDGTATRFVVLGCMASVLVLRVIEGADHFAGHRALQPYVPLACVLIAANLVLVLERARRSVGWLWLALTFLFPIEWWVFTTGGPRIGIAGELDLARTQRLSAAELGELFSEPARRPSIGTVAAGGMAFVYPGRVYDLIGLNWVAMAHASTDRMGITGHASFSPDVFWATPSEIVLPERASKVPADACDVYDPWYDEVLRGLLSSPRFRQEYRGAFLPSGREVVRFFVRRELSDAERFPGVTMLEWPSDAATRPGCHP